MKNITLDSSYLKSFVMEKEIQDIISDSECDLRRVKRKIHAIMIKRQPSIGNALILEVD